MRGALNPEDAIGKRPLIGKDIADWCEANNLERLQAVQMLAMATPHAYKRMTSGQGRLEPLPFGLEILLRRYLKNSITIDRKKAADIFQKVYGERLREFEGTPHYEAARVMIYARFGAMLGRTIFSVYRWFKPTSVGGGVSGPLRRLFDQLPDDPAKMREELEGLARTTFHVRGFDFDAMFPMPSLDRPPQGRHRRRQRGKGKGEGEADDDSAHNQTQDQLKAMLADQAGTEVVADKKGKSTRPTSKKSARQTNATRRAS